MAYKTIVKTCENATKDGAPRVCATLEYQDSKGNVIHVEDVVVDLGAHPTEQEVLEELQRVAAATIAGFTDADTIAENLTGVTL